MATRHDFQLTVANRLQTTITLLHLFSDSQAAVMRFANGIMLPSMCSCAVTCMYMYDQSCHPIFTKGCPGCRKVYVHIMIASVKKVLILIASDPPMPISGTM